VDINPSFTAGAVPVRALRASVVNRVVLEWILRLATAGAFVQTAGRYGFLPADRHRPSRRT
jgi:hypothetical protein